MIKDHKASHGGNPLPPLHGLFFSISSKGSIISDRTHTTAFVAPVVEHWPEQNIDQWAHDGGAIHQPPAP